MAQTLWLTENFETMTFAESLSFIERSRRQLHRLTEDEQGKVDADEIASIHEAVNALEISIRSHPSCPA